MDLISIDIYGGHFISINVFTSPLSLNRVFKLTFLTIIDTSHVGWLI